MPERPLNRRVRAWALWSLPPPARAYLLALDAAAAVLLVAAAASEPVTERYWIRAGVLVALAIAYVEVAGRVQRLTSYLGTGGIGSNHRLDRGRACVVTARLGGRGDGGDLRARAGVGVAGSGGPAAPAGFTAATAVLGTLTAGELYAALPAHRDWNSVIHLASVATVLVTFSVTSLLLLTGGMWLAVGGRATYHTLLPRRDMVAAEATALTVGALLALVVRVAPWMAVLVLIVLAALQRATLVQQLKHAARTDTKTGLLNATSWREQATAALQRCGRAGQPAAVLVIDLDRFKAVNDSHGHLVGDQVLVAVAGAAARSPENPHHLAPRRPAAGGGWAHGHLSGPARLRPLYRAAGRARPRAGLQAGHGRRRPDPDGAARARAVRRRRARPR